MKTITHQRGTLELYEDKLILKKKGSLFWMQSASERTYYYNQITSIEMNKKRPLIDGAFIQINTGGQVTTQGGSGLENSVPFKTNEELESAYKTIMKYYNDYKTKESTKNGATSVADEIKKYKELLDSGIITKEEFAVKKKQLLGL